MNMRKMTASDLPQVIVLAAQLGYSCTLEELKSRIEIINLDSNHLLLIASKDEIILGWVHINKETPSLLGDPRAEISALIVDEEYRGKGIGKALVAEAEKWAKSRGLMLMRVRSNTKREDAHRFYQKSGYSIAKSWHLFIKKM